MSQILSVILMMTNSLLFSSMSHPMNMGITLLIQTLMMCMLMGLMSYSSWFSYILFLVFLGGMLVLFIYMTSIASNELFQKSNYLSTFMFMFLIMVMFTIMFMDEFMMVVTLSQELQNSTKMSMTPLYNYPTSPITIFMVMYLFLTLIVIVFITKSNKGPLRPMN